MAAAVDDDEEKLPDLDEEVAEIDAGLAPGNYFNYRDHDVALQAEVDLLDGVIGYFCDEAFPCDGRALYFDPTHPPKGALPGASIKWNRISAGQVLDCEMPVFCTGRASSPMIAQGAIGDGHFVNSLRLLACNAQQMTGMLVSDKHASQGIYTLKFYKAGQWRYVHIDDRIACRQSGRVNFARNQDPNETFAMLLEKGYAKLHGCYEALVHGLLERTLMDLTPSAHCSVHRNEVNQDLDDVVDITYELIDSGLNAKRIVGCGKFVPDAYCERLADRQGMTVGQMYQIVDLQTVTNYPTEDLDALTVAFVCVRNLQRDEGFFNGAWCLGHENWTMYKEIGLALRHRTREIMFDRGIGLDPNLRNDDNELVNFVKDDQFFDAEDRSGLETFLALEQPDEPDAMTQAFLGRANLLCPQPYEKDLCWIQIEDFVDIFNRIYTATDLSYGLFDGNGDWRQVETKKFFSKWMPGDFLVGSGGPPLVTEEGIDPDEADRLRRAQAERERDADLAETISLMEASYQDNDNDDDDSLAMSAARRLELTEDVGQFKAPSAPTGPTDGVGAAGGNNGFDGSKNDGAAGADAASSGVDADGNALPAADGTSSSSPAAGGEADAPAVAVAAAEDEEVANGAGFAVFEPDNSDDEDGGKNKANTEGGSGTTGGTVSEKKSPFGPYKTIELNEDFTDNPMYPFQVSEPATINICLYQPDRRWSVGRLGEEPRDILSSEFASRGERLAACMKYRANAIGFVVVKLFGLKNRCTDFKLRKMVGASDHLAYSNACSASLTLLPGRYAVIPYTIKKVVDPTNYILHLHYTAGVVEMDVEDVMEQRLMDEDASDDESIESDLPEDDDEDDEDMTPEELDLRDEQRVLDRQARKFNTLLVKPPLPFFPQEWEYEEDIEELGVVSVYDEVGDLARYMNNLNVEIGKLNNTIETLRLHYQKPPNEEEAGKEKAGMKGSSRGGSRQGARSTTPQKSLSRKM